MEAPPIKAASSVTEHDVPTLTPLAHERLDAPRMSAVIDIVSPKHDSAPTDIIPSTAMSPPTSRLESAVTLSLIETEDPNAAPSVISTVASAFNCSCTDSAPPNRAKASIEIDDSTNIDP